MSKQIAAIKRNRTARIAKLLTRSLYLHRRGKKAEVYTLVCDEFVRFGGVYVKFLQGVLLRSQALKHWSSPDKLNIFENLHSEPLDIVKILQTEIPADKLTQIANIQPQPFAAGSFGQVYYGQLATGQQIIIKVLRPMVRDLLRYDLRLLSMFSKKFLRKMHKGNVDMNLNEAVKEFQISTLRETDYIAEAEFAAELHAAYKNHSTFIIPETFTELCTKNIIVQEYVDGISVASIVKLHEQGVDPKEYVAEQLGSDLDTQLITLGYESLMGAFDLRRIQGDPHPGNIRLMKDNKVGIIDFGISAASPVNKAAFFGLLQEWHRLFGDGRNISNLFEQFMRFFVSDLYRALKRLSSFSPSTTAEGNNFTGEVGKVAQETFSQLTGVRDIDPLLADGRVLQLVNQMVNKDNRFGLVIKLESSEILRAATTYITLVESLGRRGVVLPKVFEQVVNNVSAKYPELQHTQDDGMSVSHALQTVSNWLERVAERDPALFMQLTRRIKLRKARPQPAAESPGNGAIIEDIKVEEEVKA
ncbi:MAG: AarF/ABC1/UbiB kinase family protein [Patescibacteria group bacterium]